MLPKHFFFEEVELSFAFGSGDVQKHITSQNMYGKENHPPPLD
jgi:hypothetical protein